MRMHILSAVFLMLASTFPDTSIGQTCSPTVEVPAFMTIKVGETKDWDVEYCNNGPDTAEVSWTLTPGGCDPKLEATPTMDESTLVGGECRIKAVKVKAQDKVCAKNDAEFKVVAQACGTPANDSGKICILPTGEHSIKPRVLWWTGNGADFEVYLLPATANFDGRKVHEVEVPGSSSDNCSGGSVAEFHLTDGRWDITSRVYYNSPDLIGYRNLPSVGAYLKNLNKTPCSASCVQHMYINCDNGSVQFYKENLVKIEFDAQGRIRVTRDTAVIEEGNYGVAP